MASNKRIIVVLVVSCSAPAKTIANAAADHIESLHNTTKVETLAYFKIGGL